jgi:hypothetical protein
MHEQATSISDHLIFSGRGEQLPFCLELPMRDCYFSVKHVYFDPINVSLTAITPPSYTLEALAVTSHAAPLPVCFQGEEFIPPSTCLDMIVPAETHHTDETTTGKSSPSPRRATPKTNPQATSKPPSPGFWALSKPTPRGKCRCAPLTRSTCGGLLGICFAFDFQLCCSRHAACPPAIQPNSCMGKSVVSQCDDVWLLRS